MSKKKRKENKMYNSENNIPPYQRVFKNLPLTTFPIATV